MDKRFDSGILIANHKDTIDFYSSFLANESNEELDMAVSLSDIKNIILSMLNTITISKVDLNEAIELGLEVTDLQILKEDDFD
jgi:restriction endonuclease S subunit